MKFIKKIFYSFLLIQSAFLTAKTMKITTDFPEDFGRNYAGFSGHNKIVFYFEHGAGHCRSEYTELEPKDSIKIDIKDCRVLYYTIHTNKGRMLDTGRISDGSSTPGHIHVYLTPDNFVVIEEDGKILRRISAPRNNFQFSLENSTPYKAFAEVETQGSKTYKKGAKSGKSLLINLPLKEGQNSFTTKIKVYYSDGSKGILALPKHLVTRSDALTLKRRLIWGPRSAKNGQQWVAAIAPGTGSESSFNVGHAFGATANGPNIGAQMVATQVNIKNNFGQKVDVELIYQGGFAYPVMPLENGAQRNETIYAEQQHAKTVTLKVRSGSKEYVIDNIVDYIRADKAQQIELYKKGSSIGVKSGDTDILSTDDRIQLKLNRF